jgi:acetylcholinesterase
MSAALHMVTNTGNSEGLFHGAFMQSGAVIPRGDISLGQRDYDDLVRESGCAGAEDTLECLRQLPFATLKKAMDMSPGFFSYRRVCHDSLDPLSSVVNCVW